MKEYLGDGVYIDTWYDGYILTTDGGLAENKIYLEPFVTKALVDFIERRGKREPLSIKGRKVVNAGMAREASKPLNIVEETLS
jgi:hypothetical protein